jgi:hypothetical protein
MHEVDKPNRVINSLLLNSSFCENSGLLHGKTGIAILFYMLHRHTGHTVYEDYAGELIDEIYEDITIQSPVDFENGLAGIAWGIEYLVQNGFIDADTNEVLADIDDTINKHRVYNPPADLSLANGTAGILAYLLARIKSNQNTDGIKMLTLKHALIHLIDQVERLLFSDGTKILGTGHFCDNTSEPERFDLLYTPSLLLWLLSDIYKTDIFNHKTTRLIISLTGLCIKKGVSQFHPGNSLLLLLSFNKVLPILSGEWFDNNQSFLNFREQVHTLNESFLAGLKESILDPGIVNGYSFRTGTAGLSFACGLLARQTNNPFFLQASGFWNNQTMLMQDTKEGLFAGFVPEDDNYGFGLVNGIAGVALCNIFSSTITL